MENVKITNPDETTFISTINLASGKKVRLAIHANINCSFAVAWTKEQALAAVAALNQAIAEIPE